MQVSRNFAFLKVHSLELVRLGTLAENYFANDPNTCLIKLRQFSEQLAQLVAAKVGLYEDPDESQFELLRRLDNRRAITGQTTQLFHEIRKVGNRATHGSYGEHGVALSHLKYARILGIWFHRSYGGARQFKPGPFIPPAEPRQEAAALQAELARLRAELTARQAELTATQSQAEQAQALAQEEAELRQLAEELLLETEAKAEEEKARLAAQLNVMQAEAAQSPAQTIQDAIAVAQVVEAELDLDERETRRLIDAQLREAGWEVDTETLTYSNGTRPQKGKNLAIAEWPTTNGRADYVLFVGLDAIAAVEAKRKSKDVSGAVDQAKRYSRGFQADEILPGGPWREYKLPFVFATNGREFLPQLETKSGIWFCDVRRPENLRRPLRSWYSPAGLIDTLAQDIDQAQAQLTQEQFNYGFDLRHGSTSSSS